MPEATTKSNVLTVLSGQVREKRDTPVSIEEKRHFEWQRRMGVAFLVRWQAVDPSADVDQRTVDGQSERYQAHALAGCLLRRCPTEGSGPASSFSHLLSGLKGKAAGPDGLITFGDLISRTHSRVITRKLVSDVPEVDFSI